MIYLLDHSGKERWYFEVNEAGWAFRQILLEEGKESKISNQKKYDFFLSETELSLDDETLLRITQDEFEEVWNRINRDQTQSWVELKSKLPLGTKVTGPIEVLYPQGVIVSLPDFDTLAIANYEECAANYKNRNLHKGLYVTADIIGYDEVNYWFVVGNPRIIDMQQKLRSQERT
ncbi:hypothetical protein [Paenibacillus sp. MMS20-IR301]|uniref:hypothetical protein n=1 Tax=Paenibacillus sp. MMS20-IR301 TaxID=2895946 RepID=UPI0028F15D28|nr:hypothetical protein [Paenibacillus sp. MMS20-IR301]WNS44678.1 hypothetical protein LOS79_05225 [Paenibacillus sp. MMS20-IR301]